MIYFLYLLFISILAINYNKIKNIKFLKFFVFFFLFLIIGFRYRTGGDFAPYINGFDEADYLDNPFDLFKLIIFFSKILKLDIFGFHLITGFIFTFCLFFFLKNFKNIYLSMVISFPILIMVYGLGSLRQGLAIVIFFSVISQKSKWLKFLGIFCSLLFHLSSIVLFIIYSINLFKKKLFNFVILILILIIIINYNQILNYIQYYVMEDTYFSKGFFYRNFITFACSIFYLVNVYKKDIKLNNDLNSFFFLISILSILIYPIGFYYSTAADRVMAYFLPIQIVVINFFLGNFKLRLQKLYFTFICCLFSNIIFYIWFLFGDNSHAWSYESFFFPFKF